MSALEHALPAGGPAKLTQKPVRNYEVTARERLLLPFTLGFCVLLADSLLVPTAELTAAVFVWYALVLSCTGMAAMSLRSNRVLLVVNLFLASTMALGSNWYFRLWNLLALLVLLPVHTLALSGGVRLPWWRPAMLWERFLLLLRGLFGNLGASFAPLVPTGGKSRDPQRVLAVSLGAAGSLALLGLLLPVLSSADALFAAAAADLCAFIQACFSGALRNLVWGVVLTPFFFGLLYSLRHPGLPRENTAERRPSADGLAFVLMLAALDGLYLLFLAVQSAGLFGGAAYLAQKGISYAEWARSGFFQMVGVTIVNLTVLMAALTFSRREGRTWKAVRLLAACLVLESLVLLLSAAWRMTLYVSAYGLSFKRCLTYWGMAMMALFLLAAARKLQKPDSSFCRMAFPLALAGWLVINCVPVDHLVAKNQVDRYLNGESASISVEYLVSLSYDTLSQLERLEGHAVWSDDSGAVDISTLLAHRRDLARQECADWRTWSLSACLAAGRD